jgi:hypothetical protein
VTRIVVIMALWKREYIAKLALDHLNAQRSRLADRLSLEVLTVGSEGEISKGFAEAHGARYVEHENQPLGAKWNAALVASRELDPDGVMVLGSDNIVNDALLCKWADEIRDGIDYVGLLDTHMYRPSTDTLMYWKGYPETAANLCRIGEPIGSSRCFSRALLDHFDWVLWNGELESSLDYSVTCRVRELDHRTGFHRLGIVQHLGIKTSTGMTPMERFVTRSSSQLQEVPPEFLSSWYGEDIAAQLCALNEEKHD